MFAPSDGLLIWTYNHLLPVCCICVALVSLPSLLYTVILLSNLVKNGAELYTDIPKMAIFLLQDGGSTYTRGRLIHGKIHL